MAMCNDTPAPAHTACALAQDLGVLGRLLRALTAEELGLQRGRAVPAADASAWPDTATVDEEAGGLGVDSLARLAIVERVNQFFGLHETGAEDYLLVRRSLGEWAEIVAASFRPPLRDAWTAVTFQSSGSTGAPKAITHAMAALDEEVAVWAGLFSSARRILACAPPHHIYGFLFTVMLPERLGAELVDARAWPPSAVARRAAAGDVIVATPFVWAHMLSGGARFASGVEGVSSGAPTPPELAAAVRDAGLAQLTEVYGSSETAGVGWRCDPQAPFTLMEYWRRDGTDGLIRSRPDSECATPTPDHLAWEGDRHFRPLKRRDGAVQIGGVNVFPDQVRAVLCDHPDVTAAAVRVDEAGRGAGRARLKAFVVWRDGASPDDAAASLDAHCAARLPAPARPASYRFGSALPVNAMGKPCDWSVDDAAG